MARDPTVPEILRVAGALAAHVRHRRIIGNRSAKVHNERRVIQTIEH